MSGPRWSRRAGLAVALAVLGLAGCATAPRPPETARVRADEARGLVERWEADWRAFPGLRAAVDLRVTRRDRNDRTGAVLLLAPRQLRLEVATPFGFPALVATAGPDRLVVFRPLERTAWAGRPSASALGRWLGTPLSPDLLIGLLVGRVPPPADLSAIRVDGGADPHMAWEVGGVQHRVWVTPEGRPARLLLEGGEPIVAAFEWIPGGPLEGLRVEAPARGAALELRYLSAEYVAPPEEGFELRLPADVKIQPVD